MRLHVINPNASVAMTDQIRRSAERAAAAGTEIVMTGGEAAPVSIEGYADEALAVPPMLHAIRAAEAEGAQAHVLACFDDPGLQAAREVAAGPVFGICQSALQVASVLAARFSVVTTLPRSVPIIEDLVLHYGAGHRCRRVRSIDLPVLALDAEPVLARARLVQAIRRAQKEDAAEAVVLGCAGMSELCDALATETGIPVIDGVTAAVKLAEAYVGVGYRTSKTGAYAYPNPKSGGMERVA